MRPITEIINDVVSSVLRFIVKPPAAGVSRAPAGDALFEPARRGRASPRLQRGV